MKTAFLFFIFCVTASVASAHSYFFAFAELDYNASTRQLEISIEAAAHDVVDALQDEGVLIEDLEKHLQDSAMLLAIEHYINSGLQIHLTGGKPSLHLLGMEIKPNGLAYFYLYSDAFDPGNKLDISFDWLMDHFPEQQNKITLRYNENKYTAVFMPHRRRETIEL